MGYSGKIPLKITKNEKGCLARTRHLFLYRGRKAVVEKRKLCYAENRGLSLGGSVTLCKGGDAMMNYVTYSDLFQFGILIVAIIALCKTGDK